jgi:hypothetical protein
MIRRTRPSSPLSRLLSLLAVLGLFAFGACTTEDDPGPGTPDAAATADAGNDTDGGLLPFMSMCVENEDCESGLCYSFNAAGPHCTHSCTLDTDCEDPSPGCNGMGVCKRPQ